jgi:hypothetical protein
LTSLLITVLGRNGRLEGRRKKEINNRQRQERNNKNRQSKGKDWKERKERRGGGYRVKGEQKERYKKKENER